MKRKDKINLALGIITMICTGIVLVFIMGGLYKIIN